MSEFVKTLKIFVYNAYSESVNRIMVMHVRKILQSSSPIHVYTVKQTCVTRVTLVYQMSDTGEEIHFSLKPMVEITRNPKQGINGSVNEFLFTIIFKRVEFSAQVTRQNANE